MMHPQGLTNVFDVGFVLPAETKWKQMRRRIACSIGFHKPIAASWYSSVGDNGMMWFERCVCKRERVHSLRTDWTPWHRPFHT